MRKGWFKVAGVQDGDRTLDEQLRGLGPALAEAKGKTVLDLGAAEGLIARHFALNGAAAVLAVEIIAEHIEVGRRLCKATPQVLFQPGDIAELELPEAERWDLVLMLAVIHKTREPERVLERWAARARELLVIRLPGGAQGSVYSYPRKGNERVDVAEILNGAGFVLERIERGPVKDRGMEPVLYFRRTRKAAL